MVEEIIIINQIQIIERIVSMWINSKYTIRRNPYYGGLHFASKPDALQTNFKQEIETHYIELISKDDQHPGIGFFPLGNSFFSFSMCHKVKGTKEDNRPHDIINGFIVTSEDSLDICKHYIGEETQTFNLFFSESDDIPTIDEDSKNALENMKKFMLKEDLYIRCVHNLIKLKDNGMKVMLSISNEEKYWCFSLLSSISVSLKANLFITADMTCSLTPPDIIINSNDSEFKNLSVFTNNCQYQKLSFEEFLSHDFDINNIQQSLSKYCNDDIHTILNVCKDYLSSNKKISDHKLYATIDLFYLSNNNCFDIFKNHLKDLLYSFDCSSHNLNRFMTLLYIAFKDGMNPSSVDFSSMLTTAPYDFEKMCNFLKSKSTTRREYYQFLKAMLATQFKECFKTPIEKLAFRNGLKDMIKNFSE